MTVKNNISLAERIMFVKSVTELSKNDGVYEPALYDYAFRINVVIFFTDCAVDKMSQDEMNELAYSEDIENLLHDSKHKNTLSTLNKACREKIALEREEYMTIYTSALKNKPWDDIAKAIESVTDQVDIKDMIRTIAEENSKNNAKAYKPDNAVPFTKAGKK